MRSFVVVTALVAAGSFAQPLEKRAIEVVTETDITYATVWVKPDEAAATPTPAPSPSPTPVYTPAPAAVHDQAAEDPEPVTSPAAQPTSAPSSSAVVAQPAPAPSSSAAAAQPSPAPAPAELHVTGSTGGNSFEATCVDDHNKLRAAHGAGKVTWNAELAASAQALADTCKMHHDVTLGPASNYGQNIAFSYGTLGMHSKIAEVAQVIKRSWYTEEAQKFAQMGLYGQANPLNSDFDVWGHFTQEVWQQTTEIGCAVTACQNESGYSTVCNYNPAGNYANEFATNVESN